MKPPIKARGLGPIHSTQAKGIIMAIELAKISTGIAKRAANCLSQLAPGRIMPALEFGAGPSLAVPHPVYRLSLREVTEGRVPLQSSGIRFLVLNLAGPVGSVEVPTEQSTKGAITLESIQAAASQRVIDRLGAYPQVQANSHELRLLHIPALHTMAFWAHGANDYVIVLPPAFPPTSEDRVYPLAELLSLLKPAAINLLNSPEGTGS